MGYIRAHGAAFHRYKYSGEDHSYLAKYLLNPFWTRFVKAFPLWMPPNMITLMGFIFLVTSSLLGYIYSPQLDSPPPRWVHFEHGSLLFLYQKEEAREMEAAVLLKPTHRLKYHFLLSFCHVRRRERCRTQDWRW
ncbi:PREDICTED: choline/ethanolaminephosphotransferase 1-like isoform X2 [Brassica oleracea var. oleracea]|uniref:choline/ethanolaminephosphotransferase 1-like isoform X2 n=1 Tax=Brassica oleracea var. oleracea TaxID=109376 RepID=UPI0006A71ABB|nr:PREDICTED: choline/ethanolaminephosphotransferase 1-like isoform X2 [Brassica oleracea var. oleracea]